MKKVINYDHLLFQHHKASKTGPTQPMLQKQKSFAYREKKVSNRIILMTICFFISWGPYACVYLIPLFSHQNKGPSNIVNVLPLLVAKFGSAVINPLVYVFGNSEVRKTYIYQLYQKAFNCYMNYTIKSDTNDIIIAVYERC